jgi:uncharacterized protein YndB with AHSA1/START domain
VIRVEHEQRFPVSAERGFAYITEQANWPAYWPGLVRVEEGSRWREPGDVTRLTMKLLGREVHLQMTLRRIEPNRLVEYDSVQPGLPDARHERRFEPADGGFRYHLAVAYEPRSGVRGVYDRLLVRRGIERTLRQTTENLQAALPPT